MSVLRLMFSRRWIITTLLVVVGSIICFRLGLWQLERLEQRHAFNDHYLTTSSLPTLVLTSAPSEDLTVMEYRSILVTGTYDFENQVGLRNRVHNNLPGHHLLTPLILADGSAILVERGWVPAGGAGQPSEWQDYDQPGVVTIRGVIRLGQTGSEIGGVPDPTLAPGQSALKLWNRINVERIAQQLPYPLLPVFVQPDVNPTLTEPPYPSQPEVIIDDGPHLGYALQWFAFAGLLLFGYPFVYLRQQTEKEEK